MEYEMILKIAIVTVAAAMGLGYGYFFKQPADNSVEEQAEVIIKNETGVDIDLTPSSLEKKD